MALPDGSHQHEDSTVVGLHPVKSRSTTILDLPPSCIAFAPLHPQYFIVGTYFLESQSHQTRSGSLSAFLLDRYHPIEGHLIIDRRSVQTLSLPYAVLDLRFSPHDPDVFAVATSVGAVSIFHFDIAHGPLVEVRSLKLFDSTLLVLSLAWNPALSQPSTIAVSLSNGQITTFDVDSPTSSMRSMRAHSFEAWTVAFSHGESPDLLYSGGDDSSLYKHDTSQWSQDQSRANLASIDSGSGYIIHDCKSYGAGVTAILPVQHLDLDEPDCILTGSYDEHIRVISRGSNMRMTIQAEKRLDGEIWQLKPLPMPEPKLLSEADKEHFYVLASCMHAGARVLEIRRSPERVWSIGIIAKFDEHESMNYASDVQPFQGRLGIKDLTFVSTSFYDKRLCVWNVATC